MTTPRLYFPRTLEEQERLELGRNHRHYLKSVLRLSPGDTLTLFDGWCHEYSAVIDSFTEGGVCCTITGVIMLEQRGIPVHLGQSLPKAGKMETIIQKATELGVARIMPFVSARSVPRLTEEKARLKLTRWHKIAAEAAEQCQRPDVPEIDPVMTFAEVLQATPHALKMILWEEESDRGIKDLLRSPLGESAEPLLILVGPEGGFSPDEVEKAGEMGFISVSLGRCVLKVETAVVAALAVIQYERGYLGESMRERRVG